MRLSYFIVFFFFFAIKLVAQPDNDNCWNAIPLNNINGGCHFNASLVNATQSLPAANCNSALIQDIWFSFVADSNYHQVSVNPSFGMDAVVEVRHGNTCGGIFIACIDEGGGDGAVENLPLNNLQKDSTYFIRVYDFTGVGIKPSTWTLDICVSGFEPTKPPEIQLVNPNGGERMEGGSILGIQADVTGVIAGKEVLFSMDNGKKWEIIWQSSSSNPDFQYDWVVPSINADSCLIRVVVFQSGETFIDESDSVFTIFTSDQPSFKLDTKLSHLYWPFYNPSIIGINDFHVPSQWQNQEDGILITNDDVVNTWFFLNDHYWQSSGRWHHSGDNCFAQDWNFMNGGNSDCRMYFFSPMEGKILFKKTSCLNFNCNNPTCISGCGNYIVVQSTIDPTYAYRACHFSELNEEYSVGDLIQAGDLVARVGNEGSSSAAHLHFVLYKNLTEEDITILANGNTLQSNTNQHINPNSLSDLCFEKAANFRFDVSLDNPITNIPAVIYQPVYELKLFPNPNSGQFKLSLNTDANQFMEIEIFDPIGRRVFNKQKEIYRNGEIIEIDLTNSLSGIYYVLVKFDQEMLVKKFILKRF